MSLMRRLNLWKTWQNLLAGGLLFTFPACQLSSDAIKFFNLHIGPVFSVRLEAPLDQSPKPAASSGPTSQDQPRQLAAEFLKELHQATLERELTTDEFNRWMNVLDQGGSYEGIYNGVVNGAEYKDKETGAAPVGTIKVYADIMTLLAIDAKYDPLKLRSSEAADKETVEPLPQQATAEEKAALHQEFEQKALNKSAYALKREAGFEALRLMELKKEYKEKFATWFGHFVLYTNERAQKEGLASFGVNGRTQGDEYYHYQWALKNSEDRVRWEVLNRIHRLINAASQPK